MEISSDFSRVRLMDLVQDIIPGTQPQNKPAMAT